MIRRNLYLVLVVFTALSMRPSRSEAWSLSGAWHTVTGGVSKIASAGVGAFKSAVRWGAGLTVGPVVDGALDPAIDHAADKFREAGDHLIDHASQAMGEKITSALKQLDGIAAARIDQLDTVMAHRIDQLDQVAEKALADLDSMIKQALLQESQIITAALDREENIINRTLNHVDATLDKTVGRLEATETDAMGRMEAALQDDVPVAAEAVTRDLEWAAFFVLLAAILLATLARAILKHLGSREKVSLKELRNNADKIVNDFVLIAIPIALTACMIQVIYYGYCHHADSTRVTSREHGARDWEQHGRFAEAAVVWHRLEPLATNDKSSQLYLYRYERDKFLGDFALKNADPNDAKLAGDLSSLSNKDLGQDDEELQAIRLYFREKQSRNLSQDAELRAQLSTYVDRLLARYAIGDVPYWGKLAYMARLRLDLDDPSRPLMERLSTGISECEQLLGMYPSYAAGHLLRAELLAMREDALANGPDTPPASDAAPLIAVDLRTLSEQEPTLANLARFATYDLEIDTSAALHTLWCSGAARASEVGCEAHAAAEAEAIKRKLDGTRHEATQLLSRDFDTYKQLAQKAYGSQQVSMVIANGQFDRVIRRNQGMAELKVIVGKYRDAAARDKLHLAVLAAQQAADIGEIAIADEWYRAVEALRQDTPTAASKQNDDGKLIAVLGDQHFGSVAVSSALAYVFE